MAISGWICDKPNSNRWRCKGIKNCRDAKKFMSSHGKMSCEYRTKKNKE